MKFLNKKLSHFLSNNYPFIVFAILIAIFFWKFFLKGHVPIPFDFVVGTYFPWQDYKWAGYGAGVPVKNPLLADVPSLIYPIRIYAMNLWKTGIFPLWNDLQFGGYPLMANFQSSVLNPFNILFFIFKDHIAWSIEVVLQPFFIMLTTYIFLRESGLKKLSSVLGAVIFGFSGFSLIWLTYNVHGHVAATIPLLLFLASKIIRSKDSYWGPLFSLSLCIQVLFGYPQLTVYTVLLVGFWTFVQDYKKIPKVIIFGFLGVLLSSIQLLPGYELLSNSQRIVEGVSGGDTVAYLQYDQIINLLAPDFYGNPATYNFWGQGNYTNFAGYSGLVGLTLSIFVLFTMRSKKSINFFKILAIISLFLALPNPIKLGAATATRVLVLFNLSIAVLSAYAFEQLEQENSKTKLLLFGLPVVAILVLFAGLHFNAIDITEASRLIATRNLYFPLLIAISLGGIIFFWKILKLSSVKYAVLLLIVFELFRFGWKFTPFSDPKIEYPKTPIIEKLEMIDPDKFRINEADTIPISMWIPYGLESLSGYDAVYPLSVAKYISVTNSNNPKASAMGRYGSVDNANSKLFDLANVKYLIAMKRDKVSSPSIDGEVSYKYRLNKLKPVFEDKSVMILENKDVLPRMFFVSDWETIVDEEKVFEKLIQNDFNFKEKIILDSDFSEFNKTSGVPDYDLKNIVHKSGLVSADLRNANDGFLFISDTYFPGWEAYIDGNKTDIYKANYTFRAIPVTSGEHNILFIYNPKSFRIGKFVSGATLALLLLILIYGYKKNR